jgi:ribosomal protein S18 acetylase RimI-like enzyme
MIWLTDFYLEPAFRGRGLGLKILGMIEDEGRRMGAQAIELLVEDDNVEAQGLYKKAGFKKFDRFPMSKAL